MPFGFAVVPLAIVITLAVNTPAQPRFRDQALVELSLFPEPQLGFEDINFVGQIFRRGLPAGQAIEKAKQRSVPIPCVFLI